MPTWSRVVSSPRRSVRSFLWTLRVSRQEETMKSHPVLSSVVGLAFLAYWSLPAAYGQ